MKVFFVNSYVSDPKLFDLNQKIYEQLGKLGYDNLDDDFIKTTHEEFVKRVGESKENYLAHVKSKLNHLKKADICIFEVSEHSSGIGMLIDRAMQHGKPCVILYYTGNVPIFLLGIEDEKMIVKEYNEKNIKKVLKEAIDVARERRDKRFNFFISPKLLEYLEKASSNEGVTKSKFIRNLIMDHMRRTKGGDDEDEEME